MQQGYDAATARQFSLQNPAIYSAAERVFVSDLFSSDALRSFLIVAAWRLLACRLSGRRKIGTGVTLAILGGVCA